MVFVGVIMWFSGKEKKVQHDLQILIYALQAEVVSLKLQKSKLLEENYAKPVINVHCLPPKNNKKLPGVCVWATH